MKITRKEIYNKLIEEVPPFKDVEPSALDCFINDIIEAIELEPALETNVIEWANGQPLSDIYIGELTVKMIMQTVPAPFIFALDRMKSYIKRGCKNPRIALLL